MPIRLPRFALLALLSAVLPAPSQAADAEPPAGPPVRKVLMIGIDGCRPDALAKANAPRLHALAEHGFQADCSILGPRDAGSDTVSGPGWSSILTGVWADKHGVKDNSFKGRAFDRYPHWFARLRQARPDAVTGSFSDWKPIEQYIVSNATESAALLGEDNDYEQGDERDATAAARFLREQDPTAVCVYFGQVDETGHAKGFSASVPEYVAAIERVDRLVGEVLDEGIGRRPNKQREEWLVIVTTDHGGQGRNHGDGHTVEAIRRGFLIVSGPGVTGSEPGRQTFIVDAVPTAFAWLGVAIDPKWELDGKPVDVPPTK